MGHSCRTLLWDTLVGHSSYETSSKSHTSSLQNERFVRDFLQNSHVKVCKTSISYETSSKSQAETPIGAHTSRRPAKQFRESSPSKQHPFTRQSHVTATFSHESFRVHTSNAHKVLRLPRNVTSVTPRNLTIPCACDEISPHVSFNKICTTPHVWNDFDPF